MCTCMKINLWFKCQNRQSNVFPYSYHSVVKCQGLCVLGCALLPVVKKKLEIRKMKAVRVF